MSPCCHQSSFPENLITQITALLNADLEGEKIFYGILELIGTFFEVDRVEIVSNGHQQSPTILVSWSTQRTEPLQVLADLPILRNKQAIAHLILKNTQSNHVFLPQELTVLELICRQISLLVENLILQEKIQGLTLDLKTLGVGIQDKNQTFSHIHHELRTPLTGILGFSRMLREEIYGPLNNKQRQYIQGIVNSGEHLLSLVNDFLDMAKLDANQEELFLEMVAVEDICLSAFSIVQNQAKEQGLSLDLELGKGVDICVIDQKRIKQILLNLLSNAIKFTEKGSVKLKVERQPDQLIFSVIDTGIGIKLEDQSRLFQPFQQIPNALSRKQKGTGLGLALSKKLAQLHGGDITLSSEEGKGSCFTLYLPI